MIRSLDIFFSFIGLLLLSPLFILIAIFIKADSHGPLIYKQQRVGRYGKPFKMWKFRSMYIDADKRGLLTVGERDPRITKMGYYLRKYKLDEIPQLVNVLEGDMSLVGPRPEVQKYVDLYSEEQKKVLNIRPGITDWASIQYADENKVLAQYPDPEKAYIEVVMPAKLELNLKYIRNYSVKSYFSILYHTARKLFYSN